MTVSLKFPEDEVKVEDVNPDPRDEIVADPVEDTGEYMEPSMLDMPEFPDADQYVYRWLRISVRGEDDYNNISRRSREGWTFVKQEDLPKGFYFPSISGSSSPIFDGCVRNGDLILGKLPRKKAEGYLRMVHERAANMARAVLQDKSTGNVTHNEGRSFVTRGNQAFEE